MNIVAAFNLHDNDYIPHENLLQERYIICGSWKELGDPAIHSVSVLDNPRLYKANPHDDRHVVTVLHKAISEADVLVAHNGDKFDVRYLAGRALAHGLPPLAPIQTIDTYKIAKKEFLLNANRLDYLGSYLGLGRKVRTSPGLWLRVLRGEAEAVKEMVVYNQGDVRLLEKVFTKLTPYLPVLNFNLYAGDGHCPKCGSTDIQRRGTYVAITRAYQRFACMDCGGWFREGKPEHSTSTRNLGILGR